METPKPTTGTAPEGLPPSYSASAPTQSQEYNGKPSGSAKPGPPSVIMMVSEQVSHPMTMPQAAPPYYFQPMGMPQTIYNPTFNHPSYNHPAVFAAVRPERVVAAEYSRNDSPATCLRVFGILLITFLTALGMYFFLKALLF